MIITRYHNTTTMKLTIDFLTPTFLGGADQHAELRAAPFKNLLRQWWRVIKGSEYINHKDMLDKEGELFGSVLDDRTASASKVRIALIPVEGRFSLSSDSFALNFGKTCHPEVNKGTKISNALYLGFGPIIHQKKGAAVKRYIAAGSKAEFILSFPKNIKDQFLLIIKMIDMFGTIGSRCRNGWGSLAISGKELEHIDKVPFKTKPVADLVGEKGKEFPSLMGKDEKGLMCWETSPIEDWQLAMKVLAECYMKVRTSINIAPHGLQKRHALGYPVTHHPVPDWGGPNGRMPSQLRLMVKRDCNDRLVGRILHLPHKLPKKWNDNKIGKQLDVWRQVHTLLDADGKFHRYGGQK